MKEMRKPNIRKCCTTR